MRKMKAQKRPHLVIGLLGTSWLGGSDSDSLLARLPVTMALLALLLLLLTPQRSSALDNSLARTPPMGWM
jgi:hypothetical protein